MYRPLIKLPFEDKSSMHNHGCEIINELNLILESRIQYLRIKRKEYRVTIEIDIESTNSLQYLYIAIEKFSIYHGLIFEALYNAIISQYFKSYKIYYDSRRR